MPFDLRLNEQQRETVLAMLKRSSWPLIQVLRPWMLKKPGGVEALTGREPTQICLASKRGAAWNNGRVNSSHTLPNFSSDYQEARTLGCPTPLVATNMEQSSGYGTDEHCERARDLIREACQAPDADVYFLVGGTQTNATVIDAILLPWQGVIAPNTGHINMHEAGTVERGGHKILDTPASRRQINAADVERICSAWRVTARVTT